MTMFEKLEPIYHHEIREIATTHGADVVGFAPVETLQRLAPAEKRPSTISDDALTLIVLGKRTLHGIVWSRHLPSKQLAGGRNLRCLDRVAGRLASWLETKGYPSLPLASAALDFQKREPEDVTPAGQGSYLLRLAAVEAGLGTWGLNMMVLTPQYGPRVFFGGVLTRLALEPDRKIDKELCLGLAECGRCAAVCPEDAIPRRAHVGDQLGQYRGLDCAACARSCQPYGFNVLKEFLTYVLKTNDRGGMFERVYGRMTGEIWLEMTMMKEAAVTGCSDCTQVCPVGEDYEVVSNSPHRQIDLPAEIPKKTLGEEIEVEHLGPKVQRKITWKKHQQRAT